MCRLDGTLVRSLTDDGAIDQANEPLLVSAARRLKLDEIGADMVTAPGRKVDLDEMRRLLDETFGEPSHSDRSFSDICQSLGYPESPC